MAEYVSRGGLLLPSHYGDFRFGHGVPPETAACLHEIGRKTTAGAARSLELLQLCALFDNDPSLAFDPELRPKPDGMDYTTWHDLNSRLLIIWNLVKTYVRVFRTNVYATGGRRSISGNDYANVMQSFVSSGQYPARMRSWFNKRMLCSSAPSVWLLRSTKSGKTMPQLWQPDPCYTHLLCDDNNPDEYICVAEFSPCGSVCQFATREAWGRVTRGVTPVVLKANEDVPAGCSSWIKIAEGLGFLPAVIAHGEDRRCMGDPYTVPPARDSRKVTLRVADTTFNGSLLQKLQTKGLLAIHGAVETAGTQDLAEIMRKGVMFVEKEGKIYWAVPESRIGDTLEMLDKLIQMFSITTGVPLDDLNPLSAKGTSAEEARRRAAPLNSLCAELSDTAEQDEVELMIRGTALLEWADKKEVDLDAVRETVKAQVVLPPPVMPGNELQDAQVDQILIQLGVREPEDLALRWNMRADPDKVDRIANNVAGIIKSAAAEKLAAITTKQGEEYNVGTG